MASLFRLLFDTIGFSGALDAAGATVDTVGIGTLTDHVRFIESADAAGLRHEAPNYSPEPLAAIEPEDRDIWSFTISADAPNIEDVTCRVRDDAMKEYVVMTNIEYGCADLANDGGFRKEVDVTVFGKVFHLPLETTARLACFATAGCENYGSALLWPLHAKQDVGVIQVFVFDLDTISGDVTPMTMLPEGHVDIPEREKFMTACRNVATPVADFSPVPGLLFTDNLWTTAESQIAAALGSIFQPDKLEKVVLAATAVRVAVVCSFTPCKERADFAPGKAGGVGRLYPHLMVRGTVPLTKVLAGVRLSRPSKTTIKGGMPCGCDEMEGDIGALLITDANEGNQQIMGGLPIPYWNNLFNYYIPVDSNSPILGKTIIGVKHNAPGEIFENAIIRKGATHRYTVSRMRRQGAFDNVHIAPRMKLTRVAKIRKLGAPFGGTDVDDDMRAKWHLDDIVMAPFCVHDCFHMHWRWLESGEPGTFGWAASPNTSPGETMVPPNQDVRIRLDSPNVVTYTAEVFNAKTSEWQVVCHHGGGYALHVGLPMEGARAGIDADQGYSPITIDPSNVEFFDAAGDQILPTSSWAAFYWLIRYFIEDNEETDTATPHERVAITNLDRILKVGP